MPAYIPRAPSPIETMASDLPAKVPPTHSSGRRLVVIGTPDECRVAVHKGDPVCKHVHAYSDLKRFYNDPASPRIACPTCGKGKAPLPVGDFFDDLFGLEESEEEEVAPRTFNEDVPSAVIKFFDHIEVPFDAAIWKSMTITEKTNYIMDSFHKANKDIHKNRLILAKAIGERRMKINKATAQDFEVDLKSGRFLDYISTKSPVINDIARESELMKQDYNDLLELLNKKDKTRELATDASNSLK